MTTLDPADAVDLAPHRALQDQVRAIAVAKAAEDDIITAAEAAEGKEETLKMCTDMMAVYMCVKCDTPYCGGKVECADEMKVDKDKMVCHDCRWKEAQEAGGGKCLIRVYLTICYPALTNSHSSFARHNLAMCNQCAIQHAANTYYKYVVPTCSLIRCGPALLLQSSILQSAILAPHLTFQYFSTPHLYPPSNSLPQSLNSPPIRHPFSLQPLNSTIPQPLTLVAAPTALLSTGGDRCKEHGPKFALFKCDSCCNMATFDCCYNHYCDRCHDLASAAKDFPCPGPGKCPLGKPHAKNLEAKHCVGEPINGFVVGCTKCLGIDQFQEVYVTDDTIKRWEKMDLEDGKEDGGQLAAGANPAHPPGAAQPPQQPPPPPQPQRPIEFVGAVPRPKERDLRYVRNDLDAIGVDNVKKNRARRGFENMLKKVGGEDVCLMAGKKKKKKVKMGQRGKAKRGEEKDSDDDEDVNAVKDARARARGRRRKAPPGRIDEHGKGAVGHQRQGHIAGGAGGGGKGQELRVRSGGAMAADKFREKRAAKKAAKAAKEAKKEEKRANQKSKKKWKKFVF
jgi:hypothetical protein